MLHSFGRRALACAAAVLLSAGLAAPAAGADEDAAPRASAKKKSQLLLVHGYDKNSGKKCAGTWGDALEYYTDGHMSRNRITTIGYYKGDSKCDVSIAKASKKTPIQDIAVMLANYIDEVNKNGQSVNVVAHSMGGLVTRVAILGTEQGWKGFPSGHLKVNNVATLSTPHKGIAKPKASNSRQWKQMTWGSGFMKKLHEKGNDLGGKWAKGVDWSLIGSTKDPTVKYKSAIDKRNYADQKYKYKDFDHQEIRERPDKDWSHWLQYWHASGDHGPHKTKKGWEPLKTAYKAAKYKGDDLPR